MKTLYLQKWKFALEGQNGLDSRGNSAMKPWTPSFDDDAWLDVIVPHDWAPSLAFSQEYSSGTGYLPGGTGWYRTCFDSSVFDSLFDDGKQATINFDGVYKNSQVWVNGYYLGKRPNGYIGFSYDITHCLKKGRNIVAVKVTHEDLTDSRWFTGSGIYRKVFIDFHDAVYVRPESLVVKSELSDGRAELVISGEVVNRNTAPADNVAVRAVLDGKKAEHFIAESVLPTVVAGAGGLFNLVISIPKPWLWSSDSPELYNLRVELRSRCGTRETVFVSKLLRVGLRSIRFDPTAGFFINGKNQKIKGVCLHHDSGCLGAAFWPDVWRRRLSKLKTAGCNAIRCSHNPQAPELYDLCDEMGFYVMDEAFDEWEGCKNKWQRGYNIYPPVHQGYYEDFPQWHERDLADLVIRDRNHPSVIMWSIGNEIDYPNDPYVHPLFAEIIDNKESDKPEAERRYDSDKPNMERLATIAAKLVGIVKKHDTTRPVLVAAAFPELSSRIGFFDALDLVGYNYKEQLYEADHKRFPHLPIIGSENDHSTNAWLAVRDNDYIAGQFLWTGIDYMGEAKGWPVRCSPAGILDTAGNEKPGFYRRKILWDATPALYLATSIAPQVSDGRTKTAQPWEAARSWNYQGGIEVLVLCYTNLDSVELFLNGQSLGLKKRDPSIEYIPWTVAFERGKLEARGDSGAGWIIDSIESTLPPARLSLTTWKPASSTTEAGGGCPDFPDGYHLSQVELAVLDEEGRLCTTESPRVTFTVSRQAQLLGIENGEVSDCTDYSAPYRRAYRGRLIIYILVPIQVSGPVWIEASAEGLAKVRKTL